MYKIKYLDIIGFSVDDIVEGKLKKTERILRIEAYYGHNKKAGA